MGNKILITGGAGYIGSHTVHYLLSKGIAPSDIVVFDNLVYGHKELVPANVCFIKGDLLDKTEINSVLSDYQMDYVIHFAAYAYVGESMHNPGKYFENNILAGLNLLEAMLKGNCNKIVFSSTCSTYGIPDKNPISEKTPQIPINPYGESKLIFEKILEWYSKIYNIKSVRLRYFNACGAGFGIGEIHSPETHLIPLVLKAAKGTRESISTFGTDYKTKDGTCIRDYIHVIDLAEAHFKAFNLLNNDNFNTDYFNLGTGSGVSVKEIISISKKITGINIKVLENEKRAGDPDELVANPKKANEILAWTPKFDITASIKSAWDWEKQNEYK
jgi:UDP-glucose 4-epimerase